MSEVRKRRAEPSGARVWVAGHSGMVGSALVRRLQHEAVRAIVKAPSADLDLRRQEDALRFVRLERPDVLLLAAARVGGIEGNRTRQGGFLCDNLMIAANCIEGVRRHDVARTLVLGSSCVYPHGSPQPIGEEQLLTGPLEPTNDLGVERGASTRDQIPTRSEARSLFEAFAAHHDLPIDPLRGASRPPDRYDVTITAQRLREVRDHLDQGAPVVEGLAIRKLGRFGNSLIQLANALAVAEALHVDRLYVEPMWYLRTPATVSARTDHKVLVTQDHDGGREQDGPILEGRFLFDRSIAPLLEPHDDPFRYVRGLRPFTCFLPGPALTSDHLVIHLRAGDVFTGNDVNRRHGQPPLACYLAVLDHGRWNTVDVVFEDLGNPVIAHCWRPADHAAS